MVRLADSDIQTREVLEWKGVHLLHWHTSSCSQKTRIVLNVKQIAWESHTVNLSERENNREWYLGINPRGLVPTLIHDGAVHIESNDILMYLDEQFPEPKLVPEGREEEMSRLLDDEDDLHLDLRNLTMRYVIPPRLMGKTPEVLENYQRFGSGTVGGVADPRKPVELDYWTRFNANGGITDEAVVKSAHRFRTELTALEKILGEREFLFDDALSLLDIAWFVYVNRMRLVSYPVETLHPRVDAWFERMKQAPAFAKEAGAPDNVREQLAERRPREKADGTSLIQVAGL